MVEFISDTKKYGISSYSTKQYKFLRRDGRNFCMYLGSNGNGTH